MRKGMLLTIAVLCSVVCPTTVKAQLDMTQMGLGLMQSSMMRAQAQRDAAHLHGTGGHRHTTRRAGRSTGNTRFHPSAAARTRNLATVIARARATNPQAAAALQSDFAKGDPIVAITPALARFGLRTDDVADALAAYLVSAWYGVRGSTQDPPQATVRAVREQVHEALLSNPKFASASNAAKQQLSDTLLVQLMVTDRLVTGAKGDPAKMADAKNTIQQTALKTFKLDLTKAKLTDQGLRVL